MRQLIGAGDTIPIIASPLERARITAEVICGALDRDPAGLRTDDLLKEISFGEWEGMTFAEVEAADPENLARIKQDRWSVAPPGGESYATMAERARRWLEDSSAIKKKIVVAHGEFGRVLRGIYCGMTPADIFALDVPQDAVFRLAEGMIERIEA